jgi:hypothetical protein
MILEMPGSARRRWFSAAGLVLCLSVSAYAQFSGFVSGTYGYHRNPLYNYETAGDQVVQGYTELQYIHAIESGSLSARYIGGLMVFNAFAERNYYEHTGSVHFQRTFGDTTPRRTHSGDHQPDEENTMDEVTSIDRDSVRSYLDVDLRVAARHDKAPFEAFDNTGLSVAGSYRVRLGPLYLRVHNDCGIRSYRYLEELSNVADVLILQLGKFSANGLSLGALGQAGFKHFTSNQYDTTHFEPVRTNPGKGGGKGNAGAKLGNPSGKSILVNESTNIASQVAGGFFGSLTWKSGSLSADALYRFNTGSASRYLAQYANTSILSEDIYNDFFSYDGPSLSVVIRHSLVLGLQATLTGVVQRKRFSAPALDLMGEVVGINRIDLHGSAELWLSRYFELGGGFGLDIAFSTGAVRNQSNDQYNDFAHYQVGISAGVGF